MSLLTPLVPAFPNNLTNGTPADASQVMADFNTLRNAVNTVLNVTGATGGDQYVGLTTDARFNGTSVHDALTQLIDRQTVYTDTGAVNALVITPTPAMTTLTPGQVFWFKPANTTTSGAATINISGLGTVGLANQDGTLLLAGMLIAGSYYLGVTAGPGNPIRVINPSAATGSFTLTLTGVTASGTINYLISGDGRNAYVWANAAIVAASSSTQMTGTGVPSILSSANEHRVLFPCEDNTLQATGARLGATNTTTWVFYNGLAATSWTNAGNKGILLGAATSYPLG